MDPNIYGTVAPQVVFFLAFFVAFSLIEIVLIFTLNRMEMSHWQFVIDTIIKAKVHHGKTIKLVTIIGIIILAALILLFTPLLEIIREADKEMKIFAIVLLASMFLIYLTTTRKLAKLAIEKKIHKYLYIIISLVFFSFIVILADESYDRYQNYINQQFVYPTIEGVEASLEDRKKEELLTLFRDRVRQGGCPEIDYSEEKGVKGIRHFVYVTTDIEFIESDETIDVNDPQNYIRGKECTDGEETFLLTKYGNWYWTVFEEREVEGIWDDIPSN